MMPSRQFVTNTLLTTLRLSAVAGGLGCRVGDNQAPAWTGGAKDPDPANDYPYCVLYDIEGGSRSGDWTDTQTDVEYAYQLTVVGRRRDQAQLMVDRACEVIRHSAITDPSGAAIIRRELDLPAGVLSEGTVQQRVWVVPQRFRLHVTPA